jgi:hypothetical protein
MCCLEKIRDKMKRLTIWDFGVMKVCLIAFALMVAKLCPIVLGLDWGWYAGVFAVTYVYLIYFFFIRK